MRKTLLSLAAVAAAGAVVVPGSASAAGWNCSATALSGQPSGAPVAANVGATACKAASAGGNAPALPIPLQAAVLSARTTLDGPSGDPAAQRATATGEVSSLGIGIPTNLPINVPLTSLNVPLVGNIDITSALRTLVPVPLGNHQHAPGGLRGRDHPVGLLHRRRDRLLDEDVEAGAERQQGVGAVPVVRRTDHRGAGPWIAGGVLVRAESVGRAEVPRERAGTSQVAAGDEQGYAETPGRDRVAARDPSAANEHEPSQRHEF